MSNLISNHSQAEYISVGSNSTELNPHVSASIILPLNKDNPYLEAAILSILHQDHHELELIIVVDGSTPAFAEALCQRIRDARVRVIYTHLLGLPFSLNLGLVHCKAEIVFRMDGDDISETNRISRMLRYFADHPETTVLSTRFRVIDEEGQEHGLSKHNGRSPAQVKQYLACRCILGHPTIAFRKAAVIAAGGYAYGSFSEDYDLWLRLRRKPEVVFATLDEPLLRYRVHSLQASSNLNASKILAYDLALKIRELLFTRDPLFLVGVCFALLEYVYKKIKNDT